jgi:hypothetical protein
VTNDRDMSGRASCAVTAAVTALLISSCSSSGDSGPKLFCPQVSVPTEASSLTKYGPGKGRDLTDVDFDAEIVDIRSGCVYDTDDAGNQTIVVGVVPIIGATRGPTNLNREAEIPYFVAIIDSGTREILNKEIFGLKAEFPGNRTRVTISPTDPPISLDIPISGTRTALDYQIFVGFQLSPDELKHNLRRSGGKG